VDRAVQRIRVLIVEDDPLIRSLNRLILEQTGDYEIVGEAPDGGSAVVLAASLKPELILLDLMMPGVSGLEVLPKLRQIVPQSRVVVISMLPGDVYAEEVKRMGAIGFIDKGYDTDELIRRLHHLLRDSPIAVRA
jgi:DNA-binding NarL/FixJ family response regulator